MYSGSQTGCIVVCFNIMKTFHCQCGNAVYFLNSYCTACEKELGYFPRLGRMGALQPAGQYLWTAPGVTPPGQRYRKCNNYAAEDVCNWMVEEDDPDPFCWACRLNEVIPDLSQPKYRYYWYKIESAKRYMLYGLYQLRLPLVSRQQDPAQGLAFRFMADESSEIGALHPMYGRDTVVTGHNNGLITINLAEADDVARARIREQMQEHYRTLLGHFRHEIGHYYWARLIRDHPQRLSRYRELFGDERRDYAGALQLHYRQGPPAGWQRHYISSYASMHPWEDWAECWAHYMHMVDTLETAHYFGMLPSDAKALASDGDDSVFTPSNEAFEALLQRWLRLTVAMNALCRSMGLPDAYPFVLPASTRYKIEFIHHLIAEQTAASR